MARARHPGIDVRHSRSCASRRDGECSCKPTYQAAVWSKRDRKAIRRTFATITEAKDWRAESGVAVKRGTMKAPSKQTLVEAAEAWLAGVEDGTIRTRSGDAYKPSVIREYRRSLRLRVLPQLGGHRLSEIQRRDLQDFADRLVAQGLDPSTIRNTLMPLRAIFRRAVSRTDLAVNPTTGLELPAVRGRRDRIAAPEEATRLLAALPERDRGLWATAFYAGLRRGELRALRWEDVDLAAGTIQVRRSWDDQAGAIEPKSGAGTRSVPVPAVLRDYLDEHKIRSGRDAGLVFGTTATAPFTASNLRKRAKTAWARAELPPITLHECRHTFASLMIAAGVNAKALSTYMGHSSVTITLDRYGHLMPGNEDEVAALLDAYLERADTAARLAEIA